MKLMMQNTYVPAYVFLNGEVRLGKTLLDGLLNRKRLIVELVIEKSCKKEKPMKKYKQKKISI